jgi:Reverse transcriptase (RNA-dependent DNA polymerase)
VSPPRVTRSRTRQQQRQKTWSGQHFGAPAVNPNTGNNAEYKELSTSSDGPRWKLGMCKELSRLFQGFQSIHPEHTVHGTNTCIFIKPEDIPTNKKPTYIRIVSELRPHKADPYRVRCTVGGNLIDFPGNKSTKVAELVTIKCLLNNIISNPGAQATCIDVKDFYLNNVLPSHEFVFFQADFIPPEFYEQYNDKIVPPPKGHIYARVEKGTYGLPQAGKVASDALLPRLAAAGYNETGHIPGLFKHSTFPTYFALVVDDFLVQYQDPAHLEHIIATLQKHYQITVDRNASKFCGITLDWNYTEGHVTLSMPGYVEKVLQRFTHPVPKRPEHSPHTWVVPNYGAAIQYAEPEDTTLPLDKKGIK